MKTKKLNVTNACNIGQQITQNDFVSLTENYANFYNDIIVDFVIKKKIIENILKFSRHVAGIRFMYGLKDPLNPYSKVLFLIPCTSLSDTHISTEALLCKEGYSDHEGNLYSLEEIATFMAQYIKHVSTNNPHFAYKKITRGNFYGKNSLKEVLSNDCSYIKFSFGFIKNHISPIIQPLDNNYQNADNIYMDLTAPCPPNCGDGDERCIAEMAVNNFSNEDELDTYRLFRDTKLLDLDAGAYLYELYYFISPLIARIMDKKVNNDKVLQQFYYNQIVPFKELLLNENYQEAINHLKEVLYSLSQEYEFSKQFV